MNTTKNTKTKEQIMAEIAALQRELEAVKEEEQQAGWASITPEHLAAFKKKRLRLFAEEYEDDLFLECPARRTLYTVWQALDNGTDVYDAIGVGDSCLRECCFSEMASITGLSYDVFYDKWLEPASLRRKDPYGIFCYD